MKMFSMFSGIGGFEYGFEKVYGKAFKCIGYSEIDKYAIQVYEYHFPGVQNFGNARDIIPEQLPDFDVLTGGFPCQSFSIAGKAPTGSLSLQHICALSSSLSMALASR